MFHSLLWSTQADFCVLNKSEADVSLELSCFFGDPKDVGYLVSGFSAFSKSSLNLCKFMVHILLKTSLEDLEHYLARVWDKCNCVVVWTHFGIAFLWDWNENWPFPVLWPKSNSYDYTLELTNRFNRLDLVAHLKNYGWSSVTLCRRSWSNPKKNKCKKAKWLSEEALQIAEKREKWKAKEKRNATPVWMQSSREQQGERRKLS